MFYQLTFELLTNFVKHNNKKSRKRVHRETNNQKKFFGDNAVYDDYHQVYISEVLFANHNLHINKKREQSLTFCNVHSADANIIVTMKVLFLMCF